MSLKLLYGSHERRAWMLIRDEPMNVILRLTHRVTRITLENDITLYKSSVSVCCLSFTSMHQGAIKTSSVSRDLIAPSCNKTCGHEGIFLLVHRDSRFFWLKSLHLGFNVENNMMSAQS